MWKLWKVWEGDSLVSWSDRHVVLLSAGMMMEGRITGWDTGMPLPSAKGTRCVSYLWTLGEQNQVATREQFFVPLHQMHTYLLLFYWIKCARLFSGFAQHRSCPCSRTFSLSPPRGCSHPSRVLEQSLGHPLPQTVGDALSMGILPWRNDGCHSPDHARKCVTCYVAWLMHSSAASCLVYWKL